MKFKVILLSAILALSACDKKDTPPPTPEPQPTPVVVVTPAPVPTSKPEEPVSWKKLPTVKYAQIFHFTSLSDFKSKAKKETQIFNLELDQIEKVSGTGIADIVHAQGALLGCYTSQGWEDWRDDADQYPKDAMGKEMEDWPGERWGDPRKASLKAFLGKRMDRCKKVGGDFIELDNMDAYGNRKENGFNITLQENIDAEIALAVIAHSKGLAIVQKNAGEMTEQLHKHFDGVYVESCMKYDECDPFLKYYPGKAIVMREYSAFYKCSKSPLVSCKDTSGYFKE